MDTLKQVLLVDDSPLQLSVREAILRKAGFDVSVATNAESALATLRVLRDRIGVIITDHLMPGGGGPQLVRKVRAENDWVPIIVLSGMADVISDYTGLEVVFPARRCRRQNSLNWWASAWPRQIAIAARLSGPTKDQAAVGFVVHNRESHSVM